MLQLRELRNLGQDRGELVALESQIRQLRELTNLGRKRGELVVMEGQTGQICELSNLRRERSDSTESQQFIATLNAFAHLFQGTLDCGIVGFCSRLIEFRENRCSVVFDWLILGLAEPANQSQEHNSKQHGVRHSRHDFSPVKDTTPPRPFPKDSRKRFQSRDTRVSHDWFLCDG